MFKIQQRIIVCPYPNLTPSIADWMRVSSRIVALEGWNCELIYVTHWYLWYSHAFNFKFNGLGPGTCWPNLSSPGYCWPRLAAARIILGRRVCALCWMSGWKNCARKSPSSLWSKKFCPLKKKQLILSWPLILNTPFSNPLPPRIQKIIQAWSERFSQTLRGYPLV